MKKGTSSNCVNKPSLMFNEYCEKLNKSFDIVSNSMSKYNEIILNSDKLAQTAPDNLKNYSNIFKSFVELRENFKTFYQIMNENLMVYLN